MQRMWETAVETSTVCVERLYAGVTAQTPSGVGWTWRNATSIKPVHLVAVGAGMVGGYAMYRYLQRRKVVPSKHAEAVGEKVVELLDGDVMEPDRYLEPIDVQSDKWDPAATLYSWDPDYVEPKKVIKRGLWLPFATSVANVVKADLGCLVESPANVMMITRVVGKLLKSMNLRTCDAAKVLPVVRAIVFTPGEADIVEQELRGSRAISRNRRRVKQRYNMRSIWQETVLAWVGLGDHATGDDLE